MEIFCGEDVRENMEIFCVNTVILKEGKRNWNVNSYEMWGKMKSFLKPVLKMTLIVQNT